MTPSGMQPRSGTKRPTGSTSEKVFDGAVHGCAPLSGKSVAYAPARLVQPSAQWAAPECCAAADPSPEAALGGGDEAAEAADEASGTTTAADGASPAGAGLGREDEDGQPEHTKRAAQDRSPAAAGGFMLPFFKACPSGTMRPSQDPMLSATRKGKAP